MSDGVGELDRLQRRLDQRCSRAVTSESLSQMIEAHGLIEGFLTSCHAECASALVEAPHWDDARLGSLPPSSSALRHRLEDFLRSKGYQLSPSDLATTSEKRANEVFTTLIGSDEWATGRMMELEILIMDSVPSSMEDAYAKARWLLSLLKQDSIHDTVWLAFALEECFKFLASE